MNKTPTFEDFWKAYPRKRGKDEAKRVWNRMTAREKQSALAAIPSYINDYQKNGIPFKYPQGWLNGKRWKDYEEEPQEHQASDKPTLNNAAATPETLDLNLWSSDSQASPQDMETW